MKRNKTSKYSLYLADSMKALKKMKTCHVDSVVTDPPYGLSKEPDIEEMLKHWLNQSSYEHKSKSGFLGKEWDSFVPQPALWKEVFRVLKPGGHCLAFFSTRTHDIGTLALRMAGFEIRDTISYIYGSGFPKSQNIAKAIDKREAASKEALKFNGFGTQLKPAQELIVLCRKPLSEKTIADNVLKHGTGGINIDGCRISPMQSTAQSEGRFPANIILTHDARCKLKGTKKAGNGPLGGYNYSGKKEYKVKGFVPKNKPNSASNRGSEIVENWKCHPDCPISIMDKQSGISKSSGGSGEKSKGNLGGHSCRGGAEKTGTNSGGLGDTGGASRFFYCAKPSKKEKNLGLVKNGETSKELLNTHPTVKPLALMSYLVRLVTPVNGKVLDPFMGSGTTGMAAIKENFYFIGIEKEPEYVLLSKNE